jgi:hypothetical protein
MASKKNNSKKNPIETNPIETSPIETNPIETNLDLVNSNTEILNEINDLDKSKKNKKKKINLIQNENIEENDNDNNLSNDEIDDNKKKKKESFDELISKIEILKNNIKNIDIEIIELTKELKSKEKMKNDNEKTLYNIIKILPKNHQDEINKINKKIKNKKKNNLNSGFNKEQIVPKILSNFLELEDNVLMSRPKVMSALNNKFKELGLKNGQNTILNKETIIKLKLDTELENKEIKFTEFQSFLAKFYITSSKNEISE